MFTVTVTIHFVKIFYSLWKNKCTEKEYFNQINVYIHIYISIEKLNLHSTCKFYINVKNVIVFTAFVKQFSLLHFSITLLLITQTRRRRMLSLIASVNLEEISLTPPIITVVDDQKKLLEIG